MSGHSKWATIKHQKGAKDKARGKLFAKVLRQVEVAAREGGGDRIEQLTFPEHVRHRGRLAPRHHQPVQPGQVIGAANLDGLDAEFSEDA